MITRKLITLIVLGVVAFSSAHAAIYTLSGFTRTANQASDSQTFDFVTNDGWSGTPPNAISSEESVYLTTTVSWAAASNIGTFQVRWNRGDDGGAARFAMGTEGSGFSFLTANSAGDGDGTGPATAKPSIAAVDKTAITSVTLVMKVDQDQALINPGGDWWYGNPAQQGNAAGFMWIDPDLGAVEAGQTTPWAAWRSSNDSYQGVSFITDTAGVDLVFSDIAIYTGDDTPFAVPEPSVALLSIFGSFLLLRRRRGA